MRTLVPAGNKSTYIDRYQYDTLKVAKKNEKYSVMKIFDIKFNAIFQVV